MDIRIAGHRIAVTYSARGHLAAIFEDKFHAESDKPRRTKPASREDIYNLLVSTSSAQVNGGTSSKNWDSANAAVGCI